MEALIGLDYIFQQLNIMTPYGRESLKGLKPFKIPEADVLLKKLDDLELVIKSLRDYSLFYNRLEREFCRLKDIRGSIRRCRGREVLDVIQLFELKLFAMGALAIKGYYEAMELRIEEVAFGDLEPIVDILDPDGQRMGTFSVYDAYSDELRAVRERKREVEKSLYHAVLPHCAEELKEQRQCLVALEEALEGELLVEISSRLLPHMDILEKACHSIGVLDLTMAKARLAVDMCCVKPVFQSEVSLKLVKGRHPYVEELLKSQNKSFTPIDILLKPGANAITGPNMGGKSLTLKTIALNVWLAHLGFYVFAQELVLSVFDFIHILANDYESLKRGLSSFGGEIIQLNKYLEDVKKTRGLLLLDEFASGTNPQEGRLLVKALLKYMKDRATISLFVTHFDGVVDAGINHYQVVGLKHLDLPQLTKSLSHDPQYGLSILQNLMDYRLEPVEEEIAVPKDALKISTLLGLDAELVAAAELYYGQEV